jgi:polysaccharide pyruvyl transferase CsaB
MMGLFLKRHRQACVTTTIHSDYRKDYMHNIFKQATLGLFNTLALRIIKFHVAVTEQFARTLISRGFEAYNMFSIYNGIDFEKKMSDVSKQDYFEKYSIPYNLDELIIGIAARLTKVKDIPTLIKGFAKAYQKNPSIRLLIGGDGEDKQQLIELAENLGVSKNVHFLGWIDDVDSFFKAIDIDVISSLSETFPYSLTEGIRAGAIPISSNVGGATSLIDHKITGYIFEPRDYEALGNYLVELSQDRNKQDIMRKAIYEHTKAHFSLKAMKYKQEQIYSLILKHFNQKERNKVVICGAYGRGNAGDEAIKYTTLLSMRNIDPDMDICVMTLKPKKEKSTDRVQTIYTFNVIKLLFVLRKSKIFVSGGGSLIQDVTSSRSLFFYTFTLYLAKKLGCKVIMFGCGIGPISRPVNRKLAGHIIDKYVDVITVRDHLSKQELQSLGVTKPLIEVSADPAVNLNADKNNTHKIFISEDIPMDGKYICLALRSWKNFNKNEEIAQACEYMYKKFGYVTVFFPMEYPKDLTIAEKTAELLSTPYYLIHKRYPTEQVVAFMSKMDQVVAMRLHALIFAAANYVPVVGISYDVKVSGFMSYIESSSCLELKDVTKESLIHAMEESFLHQDKVIYATNALKEKEAVNKHQFMRLMETE